MQAKIMLAAAKSGSGKTTITCALLKALSKRGLNVHAFKCGPDYIDPMFHERVLGIKSKNLDLFFTDEYTTRELFALGNDSDISVIEGVMGLYDGIGLSSRASSYELAAVLDAAIVLIVDAKGMGHSLFAAIRGYLDEDTDKRIAAVILNRVSEAYYSKLKPMIEKELGIEVLGYMPNAEELVVSSRHLGLMLPDEIENIEQRLNRAANICEESVDIDRLLELSHTATENVQTAFSVDGNKHTDRNVRVAIAMDEAFCFYYDDNLRMLKEAGLSLIPFSPIHDERLPEDISGLILGGGYPENYLSELAENKTMLNSVKKAIASGIPSLAECGGFMYLHEWVSDLEGRMYSLAGVLKGKCEYKDRLVRFGYVSIEEKNHSFITDAGNYVIKGHEFHYYDSDNAGQDCISTKPASGLDFDNSHVSDKHWWGFTHLYYPSNPEFVNAFALKACEAVPFNDIQASQRFFANTGCSYYPCHKGIADLNCMFCYCPMYPLKNCPGNPQIIMRDGKKIKKCTDCTFPHIPSNYDKIMQVLKANRQAYPED